MFCICYRHLPVFLLLCSQQQACVQYILRVGVAEQMGEPAQKEFTYLLTKEVWLNIQAIVQWDPFCCLHMWSLV